jgi:thymidylate kinase
MHVDSYTKQRRPSVRQRRAVILVSFSGVDGAGKTTQIKALQRHLTKTGSRVLLFSFWDDVVVLRCTREELGHSIFGGDRGVGRPDKPLRRKDKNVRSWYMTIARFVFYSLDTMRMNLVVAKARKSTSDVVIFDRYIYDEFANLLPCGWITRTYMLLLLRCTPKPDIAYLLDADPEVARARKPEYPVGFLKRNRESYLALSELAGMTIISPLPVLEVSQKVMEEIQKQPCRTRVPCIESLARQRASACDENVRAGADR